MGAVALAGVAYGAAVLRSAVCGRGDARSLCGRDAGRVAVAADRALGWDSRSPTDWRRGDRPVMMSIWSISVLRVIPMSRSRSRRLSCGQARVVREAVGQQCRAEAEAMVAAARERCACTGCGRWWGSPTVGCPAIALAAAAGRRAGRLGGGAAGPGAVPAGLDRSTPSPLRCRGVWTRSKAGSGALGDIGAHIVDLAQFVTGLDRLVGCRRVICETFVARASGRGGLARPAPSAARSSSD